MFEFKTRVYTVLAADTALTALLSKVPGTSRPAIYLNHLSQFQTVTYPAVSLFWAEGGADAQVQQAESGVLLVDIWTEERPAQSSGGIAGDLSGAWAIYRRIKPHLHRAQLGQGLADPAYRLAYCVEMGATVTEEFDEKLKLYHVQSRYRVVLMPVGAEMAYPL